MSRVDGLEPWDRQDGETALAYRAFRQYLDMGPKRSLRRQRDARDPETNELTRVGGYDSLCRWSSVNNWVERAVLWDAEQHRIELIEMAEGVRQMRYAHASLGSQMLMKGMAKIDDINPSELTVREAVAIIELGAKLERQGRGEADQTIDHRIGLTEEIGPRRTSEAIWTMLLGNPDLADSVAAVKAAIEAAAPDEPEALPPADVIDTTATEAAS
jgi:hypothetical protein